MATLNEKMTVIADAIRDKTKKTDRLTLDDMKTGVLEVYDTAKECFGVLGKESGTVVRADNVNENEHIVKVGLSSKNKIPFPYKDKTKTENGLTFTVNDDGSITLNGTPTGTAMFVLYESYGAQKVLEKGKIYTFSLKGTPESWYCFMGNNVRESTDTVWGNPVGSTEGKNQNTATVTKDYTGFQLYIVVTKKVGTLDNVTVYPQIEENTTATAYTPYVADVTSANVTASSNILPFPYYETSKTNFDLTFTVNDDGSITLNGTSNHATFELYESISQTVLEKGKTYRQSLRYANGDYVDSGEMWLYSDFSIDGKKWDTENYARGNTTFTAPEHKGYHIMLVVGMGTTYDNVTVYPQIECEPYKGATYTPNVDGTLEIPSISPTMMLTTDKQGVNIECEYYLDGQAVIDELTDAIISLGGTI